MESQDEPLIQSWIQLSMGNFWEFVVRVRDFLDESLEDILFWAAAAVLAMMYLVLFAMLIYYQRRY
jgi:hypothetical protein